MLTKPTLLYYIKRIGHPVFTSRQMADASGKSLSTVTQSLNHLCRQHAVVKLRRGLWGEIVSGRLDAYAVVPYLTPGHRAYVSFVSALSIHGIISQIPPVVTVASTAHSRRIRTSLATYSVHQIASGFFEGFDWDASGGFLIAEPEKALADCLYLAAHRKRQYGRFPELEFPESFRRSRVRHWVKQIRPRQARLFAERRLQEMLDA